MSDVLSQSEIDALIQALATGELDAQEIKAETDEIKVKKYDFRRPDKFAKDQLRTLQIIHENFSRLLNTFLSGYLRSLVHVEVLSVEQLSNYEFTNSISNPAVLGIVDFSPLDGQIILDVTSDIAFVMIDRILGGNGKPIEEKRNFTEIEISLLRKLIKQIIKLLKEPWENVVEIEPKLEKIETNSQFAQIVSPNETIALITLNIKIGEVEGMVNLCIPHIVIEPILPKLNTKFWFTSINKERTSEDEEIISKRVEKTKVTVRAVLGKANITVRDFLDLQVGDVIQLDTLVNDHIKLFVGNKLKYYGRPGTKKKKMAVQIEGIIERGDE
ncbi:flagellar motor switch protein FliM [Crassaminicella thermophila]|uniref:Flagellar motor switch protein FliM n=1 Tax=Crassaminicella thermophila TaxID=2599308 RepID=A0A5C0SER7_CRATE|nr:flagellar motor switch protein FliM [Crassaminicella thermophila]QEK12266.1 flagellar motor switch protein FliM [Crassaminicella thermophila]